MLFLSFYNLDYGIGASASFIDQLSDLPSNVRALVIEPNRIDLSQVKVEVPVMVERVKTPLPLTSSLSFLYPFLAFFYGLKIASALKTDIIFSMHHPFHTLSLSGHIISRILHVPHVVDLHDVWRPMGQKLTICERLKDIIERKVARIIKNDIMIFVCSEHKQILESRAKITFKNALILPNCVSSSLIKTIKVRKTKKGKNIQFIFVGRVGREYGLDKIKPFLDALKSVGYKPSLLVIGHNQVGVHEYATYIGSLPQRETLQLIAESDIGIGPMNPTITVPKKVVEYLALRKAIIVGKNAVSSDIIKEYGDYIIEVSEADNVNQAILRILTMLEYANRDCKMVDKLYCEKRWKIIFRKILSH
ncbi:MAG: glycosyltransferase [Candidatus Bathyarchaeia archaeon]